MKTRYVIVDSTGEQIDMVEFPPWQDIPVRMKSVTYCPNTDPDDPSESELVMTLVFEPDRLGEDD